MAYRTMALIDVVDFERDLILALRRDSLFLAASSMTRKVLSLADGEHNIPDRLWKQNTEPDPFAGMNESQLHELLASGLDKLREGLLEPRITVNQENYSVQSALDFSVVCRRASIEEFLAGYSKKAGIDLKWECGSQEAKVRNRPLSLFLSSVTADHLLRVSAGCTGLLATRLDIQDKAAKETTAIVYNPDNYVSVNNYMETLTAEAIALWQRFLLVFHNDSRIPNAHFAIGLLSSENGQIDKAIAEYKMVANRFSQTYLAPFALLHSSEVKASQQDYFGAREDLQQLLQQYPDVPFAHQACLRLADITMQAGLNPEAAKLYQKVYYLGFSTKSQIIAAFRAAQCFYQQKQYKSASEWLVRYISIAKHSGHEQLHTAYLMLGNTNLYLGKLDEACKAFESAVNGKLSRQQYIEAVTALVKTYINQGSFIAALGIIENIKSWQFSEEQFIEILLVKSEILREMGLVEKAIVTLTDRAEYTLDHRLKAKLCLGLAKCYIDTGDFVSARDKLDQAITVAEPGELADKANVLIAETCLELGKYNRAISICERLLNSSPPEKLKERALNVLASAYDKQKNYKMAALALLGKWDAQFNQQGKDG